MPLPHPDLENLRDRVNITWGYLRRQMAGTDVVREMDAVVDRVTAGRSLRQLRMVAGDLQEWAAGLRPEQRQELQALIAERFGPAVLDGNDDVARDQIIQRGRIRTADEYRLISARVEAIYSDHVHREELEVLHRLLATAAARRRKVPGD